MIRAAIRFVVVASVVDRAARGSSRSRFGGLLLLASLVGGCGEEGPPTATVGIPCDVQAALDAKCNRCHDASLAFGAPYPLTSFESFHEVHGTQPVYASVKAVIEDDYMPPVGVPAEPPIEPLTAAERSTLIDWLDAEAPAVERSGCD
jgi:hypothetical protein